MCCAKGNVCQRQNEYFHMCVAGINVNALPRATRRSNRKNKGTTIGSDMAATAAASLTLSAASTADVLTLSAPPAAPAGTPVEVFATMTRLGQPVPGAVVTFVVSSTADSTETTMIEVATGEDGVARTALAVSAAAGDRSVLSASTADGRAMGVRGNVVITANDAKVSVI
jgi:hypothetical protein